MQKISLLASAGMAARSIISVEVPNEVRDKLPELMANLGIKQRDLMARLIEWFAGADEMVQTAIITRYPSVRRGLGKLIADELAKAPQFETLVEVEGDPPHPQDVTPQHPRHIVKRAKPRHN